MAQVESPQLIDSSKITIITSLHPIEFTAYPAADGNWVVVISGVTSLRDIGNINTETVNALNALCQNAIQKATSRNG